jgi:hypothetical protein
MVTPDQVENRLREIKKQQTKHGERLASLEGKASVAKPENWLKRHPYWVTILSLLLGTGLIWKLGVLIIDAEIDSRTEKPNANRDSKIAKMDESLQKLAVDFGKMSSKLDTFIDLEKDRLKKIGDLTPPQFQRALPELRDAIQDAVALKVPISPAVQSAIQNNLLAVSTREPSYWPTVAQYITYRSEAQPDPSPFLFLLQLEKDMRCYDRLPTTESFPLAGPFSYSSCVIDLGDHPDEQLSIIIANLSKKGRDKHFIFSFCVVKYSGERPINPILAGAVFNSCFYVFSANPAPSLFEQRVIRAVLDSQGSTVKVPG